MTRPGFVTAIVCAAIVATGSRPSGQAPDSEIVDIGAARLETMTWGQGEAVILLPGSGYSSTAFSLLGPELARRGYRAIAVNPRGVRGSVGPLEGLTYHDYAADVAAVVDRVAGGRAHLLGWAWGNRIARSLAADSPRRVGALVLVAAGGKVPADPSVAQLTQQLRRPGIADDERTRLLALRMLAPGSNAAPLVAIQESWEAAQAAQGAAGRATPLDHWWGGGSAPMLVIQGLQDKVAPPGNGRDLKASYPDRVTLVEIDGAGHGIIVEHPARLAAEAVRFMEAHPLRQSR